MRTTCHRASAITRSLSRANGASTTRFATMAHGREPTAGRAFSAAQSRVERGHVRDSTSHCHWPSKARDALLSLLCRAWFQECKQTAMKKMKPLPIPLNLVKCGQTGRVLTPANDNHPKYMGPHVPDRDMASKLGAKYYNTGAACIHGHTAPRSTSDGKCTVCKWLQWEANRRKKERSPFNQIGKRPRRKN